MTAARHARPAPARTALHDDGWVSRACRRGYHRHCPGGCECSCHDGRGPVGVLACSNPPAESCSDAGCPMHGDDPYESSHPLLAVVVVLAVAAALWATRGLPANTVAQVWHYPCHEHLFRVGRIALEWFTTARDFWKGLCLQ